jgi:YegS/Rv2252/BmrU family lipid kinase
MNVLAIVNPLSGARAHPEIAARRVALLERRFDADGIDGCVRMTERSHHAAELAAEAVRSGVKIVIAWGGDGTVNETAGVLTGTDVVLCVIPAGFANALRIPHDPLRAIEVALAGEERVVDVGEIDGRRFFNVAGIGFDATVAEQFNRQEQGQRGMLPYVRLGIRELFRYHGSHYRCWLDGSVLDTDALFIAFANGIEFGNGVRIAPHARVDDGKLEAVVVEDRSLGGRLWLARHLITRNPRNAARVHFHSIAQATIETDRPIVYHVDGEPGRGGTTVAVRVHPGALRVRAPRRQS